MLLVKRSTTSCLFAATLPDALLGSSCICFAYCTHSELCQTPSDGCTSLPRTDASANGSLPHSQCVSEMFLSPPVAPPQSSPSSATVLLLYSSLYSTSPLAKQHKGLKTLSTKALNVHSPSDHCRSLSWPLDHAHQVSNHPSILPNHQITALDQPLPFDSIKDLKNPLNLFGPPSTARTA